MKNNFKPKNSGFTLIEALIAAMIIIVVSAGVVVLTFLNLRNAVINKHRLQATWLAQQGVEGLRQVRDTHWIDKNPNNYWDTDPNNTETSIDPEVKGVNCNVVAPLPPNLITCNVKDSSDFFNDDLTTTGADKDNNFFTRTITITPKDASKPTESNSITVKVEVKWSDYGHDRNATINTKLTNWRKY